MEKYGSNMENNVPYIVFDSPYGDKISVLMPMTVPAMKKRILSLLADGGKNIMSARRNRPYKKVRPYDAQRANVPVWEQNDSTTADFFRSVFIEGSTCPQETYGDIVFFYGGRNYRMDVLSVRTGIEGVGAVPLPVGIGNVDAMYSPNVSISRKNGRTRSSYKDLLSVKAFAIDVDYNNMNDDRLSDYLRKGMTSEAYAWAKRESPLEYFERMVTEGVFDDIYGGSLPVPMPNYIEYSHNLRLIYVLDDAIKCRIPSGSRLLSAVHRLQEQIVNRINEWDCEASAEVQEVTKYFRVPGSVNRKDGSVVRILPAKGGTYDVRHLISEYMDDLPAWYTEWKNGKDSDMDAAARIRGKRTEQAIARMQKFISGESLIENGDGTSVPMSDMERFSIEMRRSPARIKKGCPHKRRPVRRSAGDGILSDRIERMERLQRSPLPVERREILCFVYGATYQELHRDDDVVEAVIRFNKGFSRPLPEKEIRSKFRTLHSHTYMFRESTFCRLTGVDERSSSVHALASRNGAAKKRKSGGRYNREKWDMFMELTSAGMKRAEIASAMGITVSGVDYYRRQMKKDLPVGKESAIRSINMLKRAAEFYRSCNTEPTEMQAENVVVFSPRICILLYVVDSNGGHRRCIGHYMGGDYRDMYDDDGGLFALPP